LVDQPEIAYGTPNLELSRYLCERQRQNHKKEQQYQHASGPDQDFTQYVGLHQIVGVHVPTPQIDDQDAAGAPRFACMRQLFQDFIARDFGN
jgi:hypothetical protein